MYIFSGSLSEERNDEIRPPMKRIKEETEFVNEPLKDSNTLEEKTDLDPNYVQIIASKQEVWLEECGLYIVSMLLQLVQNK